MTTHSFSLLCGYSLDNSDSQIHRGLLQRVSTAHSDVIPVDDYARLDRAVERAYADIFGPSGEPASLRSTFLAHYARPAAMPDAEAAILAVRQFVPVMAASASGIAAGLRSEEHTSELQSQSKLV